MGNIMGGGKSDKASGPTEESASSFSSSSSEGQPSPRKQPSARTNTTPNNNNKKPQPKPSPPPAPPMSPTQRCEFQLGEIEKKILEILQEIEKVTNEFYGNSATAPLSPAESKRTIYQLGMAEEGFMQQLLHCDNCEVPDEDWRGKRREMIRTIQSHQAQLDQTKKKIQMHINENQQQQPDTDNPAMDISAEGGDKE